MKYTEGDWKLRFISLKACIISESPNTHNELTHAVPTECPSYVPTLCNGVADYWSAFVRQYPNGITWDLSNGKPSVHK